MAGNVESARFLCKWRGKWGSCIHSGVPAVTRAHFCFQALSGPLVASSRVNVIFPSAHFSLDPKLHVMLFHPLNHLHRYPTSFINLSRFRAGVAVGKSWRLKGSAPPCTAEETGV